MNSYGFHMVAVRVHMISYCFHMISFFVHMNSYGSLLDFAMFSYDVLWFPYDFRWFPNSSLVFPCDLLWLPVWFACVSIRFSRVSMAVVFGFPADDPCLNRLKSLCFANRFGPGRRANRPGTNTAILYVVAVSTCGGGSIIRCAI